MRSGRLKIPSPGADASPPHHNACPKGIEADSRSEPAAHGYHRAPVREVVDTPFFPRTGANRRGHHALSLAPSVSCFGRNEHGVSVWRLARCHDTDDTNRGCGDTRTIRWMVKMACSETFEISIDWRPERHPLPEWRYETVPTEPPPSRTRIMASLSRILLGNRSRAAGYGIAAAVLSPANSGAIQVCSCSPFTRLVLVQLIFLVTDR
jgi:hypothetical protein